MSYEITLKTWKIKLGLISQSWSCWCHSSTGLPSPLWDLSSRSDQQRQPPSSQPVSHYSDCSYIGHHLLRCCSSCVRLPSGLAQCGLQHCGRCHLHLHPGHQLHAVCSSGERQTTSKYHTIIHNFLANSRKCNDLQCWDPLTKQESLEEAGLVMRHRLTCIKTKTCKS